MERKNEIFTPGNKLSPLPNVAKIPLTRRVGGAAYIDKRVANKLRPCNSGTVTNGTGSSALELVSPYNGVRARASATSLMPALGGGMLLPDGQDEQDILTLAFPHDAV